MTEKSRTNGKYDTLRREYRARLKAGGRFGKNGGKFVDKRNAPKFLARVIKSGDRVCLEGNNQKQADFLARSLVALDPKHVSNLHLVQSSVVLPEHTELFRKGIAERLDFAYSGPQAKELYLLAARKQVKIGAIHTYLELFGRYFVDLSPRVSLVVAEAADMKGNLFTGANTEDTPLICEATRFRHGVVVAQVKKKVRKLPRVDIPADWVDFIFVTDQDYHIAPLFTRDPAKITDLQVLMAMMVLRGIYEEYGVTSLNHGIGFATAAVELLLPTFGRELKGRCCTNWILNPHPTLIPAIEAGFVKHVYSFGSEPGMEDYVRARSDVFSVGPDGHMRSNRCYAHAAGLYAVDLFIGATLQIDRHGNSSTAIRGMIAGFGGAPNLGSTPPGRRNLAPPLKKAGRVESGICHGRKLVVQVTPTVSEKKGIPVFVDELDAVGLHKEGLFDVPPVMITGDQITHIVTERGIAYLDRCPSLDARMKAVAAIAGGTAVGKSTTKSEFRKLRRANVVRTPGDLGIISETATRELLAARSLEDLVEISGGLYKPPASLLRK